MVVRGQFRSTEEKNETNGLIQIRIFSHILNPLSQKPGGVVVKGIIK